MTEDMMDIVKPKSSYEIRLVPAYVRPITVTVSAVMLVGAMLPGMFWMFFGAIFSLCAFASCAFFTYARDARTLQTLRDHDVRNLLLLTCGNETNIPHTKMRRTQFYAAVRRIVARSDQQRQIRFIGVGEYNGVHVGSPSPRKAWIETGRWTTRTRGVRSPSPRKAWIETVGHLALACSSNRRLPPGRRGLKQLLAAGHAGLTATPEGVD